MRKSNQNLSQLLLLGGLVGVGIEQKGKRTHGHGQQWGDCWKEEV